MGVLVAGSTCAGRTWVLACNNPLLLVARRTVKMCNSLSQMRGTLPTAHPEVENAVALRCLFPCAICGTLLLLFDVPGGDAIHHCRGYYKQYPHGVWSLSVVSNICWSVMSAGLSVVLPCICHVCKKSQAWVWVSSSTQFHLCACSAPRLSSCIDAAVLLGSWLQHVGSALLSNPIVAVSASGASEGCVLFTKAVFVSIGRNIRELKPHLACHEMLFWWLAAVWDAV